MDPTDLSCMSDTQLQAHIEQCGLQMLAAEKLGLKDQGVRWLRAMEAGLRERASRPQMVAALEQAKGLA